jgi:uncharacterized protein YjaZ
MAGTGQEGQDASSRKETNMRFEIVDTEAAYRRLLAADSAAEREAIFSEELVKPFEGLIQRFGFGQTGLNAFAMWKMSPEQFAPEKREEMSAVLDELAAADAWNRAARALDKGWAAFARYADRVTLEQIVFALMYADIGTDYSGFGGMPGYIMTVYGTPDAYTLRRVEAATVHELHHNLMGNIGAKGGAAFDWSDFMNSTTVADYMIGEGLAEALATELYGEEVAGPWVNGFDESKLDEVKGIFRDGLHLTGFNTIRAYIFGDQVAEGMNLPKIGLPPLAGYAVGYRIVKAYTQRTGKSVVDTSFVPASEIIAESRFFA